MGYHIEGIADDLSREFHAMSFRRDRQWRPSSRGGDSGLCHESSAEFFTGAPPRPLSCANGGGFRSSDSRKVLGESERHYDMYVPRWGCPALISEKRAVRVEERTAGSTSRDLRRQDARRSSGMSRSRAQGRSGRSLGGQYGVTPSLTPSCTYSSPSSYLGSGDSASESGAEDPSRVHGGLCSQEVAQKKSTQPTSRASARPRLRGSLVGSPPLDAPPPGAIRWVEDDRRRSKEAQRGGGRSKDATVMRQRVDAYQQDTVMMNPEEPLRPRMSAQVPPLQPTGFLRRIIAAVAHFRGVPPPPSVPPEVILAFDEYVSRGSMMLKFVPSGPPHQRFFVIRFLEVVAGSSRFGGGRAHYQAPGLLQAVLSWYRSVSSRRMIRFLPLHDLVEVKADGTDHEYVCRRMVQPGIVRGPRSGFVTSYVRADFILQFRFCSRLSQAQEAVALMATNRTQYLAWLVVGSFISQIGGIY
ncbi:hypothetical protein LSCM4_01000 [Leishmania orientalis]|uniref:PH-like domain-containing protein n=1 Tax=Leishmania orientalis TaxID=2249476 RepID=A0A836K965_9TRYP|nr:hypothetical protein LSCM4_01000 [Leishmania orientalis]